MRNNVEATIFQMGFHYSNNKSRYRGLAKHKLWAYSRALWVNFVRLQKYGGKLRVSVAVYAQNSISCLKLIIIEQVIFKTTNINYKTNKSLKTSQFPFF